MQPPDLPLPPPPPPPLPGPENHPYQVWSWGWGAVRTSRLGGRGFLSDPAPDSRALGKEARSPLAETSRASRFPSPGRGARGGLVSSFVKGCQCSELTQEEMKPREGKGLARGHTASQSPTAGPPAPRSWAWVSASRPLPRPELLPPSVSLCGPSYVSLSVSLYP